MNKAFTIIEVIFVIVIISILSIVLIPRLMTTRDDSKISTCLSDIKIVLKDLSSYYTSQSKFSSITQDMTNVRVLGSYYYSLDSNGLAVYNGTISYVCQNIDQNPAVNFTINSVALPGTLGYEYQLTIKEANSTNNIDKQLIQQMKKYSLIGIYTISGKRIKN